MRYFSYVVARDYGFAPNPFSGYCTLATCKPKIRGPAAIGDWVIGTGSSVMKRQNQIIFAMRVAEKLSYTDYWNDPRFQIKKPVMNGSLKKMYGDNIYCHIGNQWHQADSHHSLEDGSVNTHNLDRDTSEDSVLVATYFYYLGRNSIPIPEHLVKHVVKKGPGHRCPSDIFGAELITFLGANRSPGYGGDPVQFEDFEHYDGKS